MKQPLESPSPAYHVDQFQPVVSTLHATYEDTKRANAGGVARVLTNQLVEAGLARARFIVAVPVPKRQSLI